MGFLSSLVLRPSVVRQAVRTVVAALVAELVVRYFDLGQGYWAVLTAITVVQLTVGATIRRGVNRMLATCVGAAAGMLGLWLQVTQGLSPTIAMVGTLFVTALAGAAFPILRLAPTNAAVVLLGADTVADILGSGVNRVYDVIVGTIVGILTAFSVLPVYAGLRVKRSLAFILWQCSDLLAAQIDAFSGVARDPAAILALSVRINRRLAEASALAADAGRELNDIGDITGVVRATERLHYSIMAIDRGGGGVLPVQINTLLWHPLHDLTEALRVAITETGNSLSEQRRAPPLDAVNTSHAALSQALLSLRLSGAMRGLDPSVAMRVYSVILLLDEVVRDLKELTNRINELRLL